MAEGGGGKWFAGSSRENGARLALLEMVCCKFKMDSFKRAVLSENIYTIPLAVVSSSWSEFPTSVSGGHDSSSAVLEKFAESAQSTAVEADGTNWKNSWRLASLTAFRRRGLVLFLPGMCFYFLKRRVRRELENKREIYYMNHLGGRETN